MKQLFAVAKTEFKTRLRGKYILCCLLFLAYWVINLLVSVASLEDIKNLAKSGIKITYVYDFILNNSFNVVKSSFPISVFCCNMLYRDKKSADMDIYCSTTSSVGGYYFGKFLGNVVFFIISTFAISIIHALSLIIIVDLKLMPALSFHGLSTIDMVIAFIIFYLVTVLPAILYGIIIPLTFSNFVKNNFVILICAVIEIPAFFLPENINFLKYMYWEYFPIYENILHYPKFILKKSFNYGYNCSAFYTNGQKFFSFFIITFIAVFLLMLGYVKFRHDMSRKEFK